MIRLFPPPFRAVCHSALFVLVVGGASPRAAVAPAAAPHARDEQTRGLLTLAASLTDRQRPDYAAAEVAFWQVLNAADTPAADLKTALLGLAHLHRKKGELTKAAAIYERYLSDYAGDDRSPDALLELGRTLRDMGAYHAAITRFYNVINSTLKVPANDFERYQVLAKTAQFEIAETHFDAGEFGEANKYYSKFRLLDVAPGDRARAQFKAADALRRAGSLETAAAALRSFIHEWPDDENSPEARYLLALTLRDLKRPQESYAVTLDLLRVEKSRVAAAPKRWLYWQLMTGNQLANEFFDTGDTAAAHTIYSALLSLSPDLSWRLPVTYQLGVCYERLGVTEQARHAFRTVLELAGGNPAPQFAALTDMAAWQIDHLAWRESVGRQIDIFFNPASGDLQGSTPGGKPALP